MMVFNSQKRIYGLLVILCLCCEGHAEEVLSRSKREARKCKDKFMILGTHSACQPKSSLVQYAGVNQSEIQHILEEHNRYRASVNPPAANMLKMYWDLEVAEIAQSWAETCSFTHDENWDRYIPGGLSIGQNIGKGYFTWTACIKAWYDENKYFQLGGNVPFEKIGHYTQVRCKLCSMDISSMNKGAFNGVIYRSDKNMVQCNKKVLVWAISNKVGCGMANCGKYNFHVCNYAPAGNIGDHNKPYKKGTTGCDDCPTSCQNKLCDCGNKACENMGTLHPGNCSCTCKNPSFQIQPVCKLNCSDVTEPWMCGTGQFNRAGCRRYSGSVPSACPLTCETCPYAGYNYVEQGVEPRSNDVASRESAVIFIVICLLATFM